jgi:hypothetical protein
MELNYDMILLLQHILYLYCIHDHFVKKITIIFMITCHNAYYYSLNCGSTLISFPHMEYALFHS